MRSNSLLPATWLAERLAVDPARIDAMRRDGELVAVREPGSTDWDYPSWQLRNGEPLTSIRRITRAAREAGLDESRLYTILSARRGLNGAGHVYELLRAGRDDEVVELVRAG
jgi:transposase InsO family protein